MRNLKWRIAAVFALLPTVFGQLTSANAADAAPTATTYPVVVVSDELVAGNSVSLTAPDWVGTPAPTVTSQWYSCANDVATAGDILPAGCLAISGATSNSFTLTNSQKAKYLVVGSFAANSQTGNTPVARYSATTTVAVQAAPALKPAVLGSNSTVRFTSATAAKANSKYSVDLTGWVTATSYTYKWYRCDQAVRAGTTAPSGCDEIVGATAASYVVTASDVDKVVTSFVTAQNGTTNIASIRIASDTAVMQAPVNSAPASVFAGQIVVGRTVTAIDGTWLASPSPTFTYQWYSCTAAVAAAAVKNAKCAVIAGATNSNYLVSATDNNKFLVVQVKAVNAANTSAPVSSFSASSSKVLSAPANTVQPKLAFTQTTASGQPIVGSSISVVPGTWTGNPAPTKTYQWYYCDSAVASGLVEVPSGCTLIDGANGTSITATLAMQGKFVIAKEIATNPADTKSAVTASDAYVQTKPLFGTDPVISGTAESGGTLSVSSGASSVGGSPTESYTWAKCATAQVAAAAIPVGCTVIAGKIGSTIDLDTSLEGYFLVARVTLTNAAGQTVRTSASSAQITGSLVNVQISKPSSTKGSVQLSIPVEANDGTWTGFPQPTFEYAWYRCSSLVTEKADSIPAGCEPINGATSKTYTPVSADAAKYLSVKVVAVQGSARVSVWSPTSYQVLEAPSFLGSPAVGNQHVVGGANLVPAIGSIRGTSDPQIDYAWYRCSAPVADDSAALAVGCSIIGGATSASYAFTNSDVGKYVLASITLTNELGVAKRFTSSSQLVNVAPVNLTIAAPTSATNPAKVGVQLTEGADTWSGNPAATFSRQWFRCDTQQRVKALDVPPGCTAIGGQILETYTPTTADSGKFLLVAVRGFNEHGSQTVYSPSTPDIAEAPRFNRGPILNNLRDKGRLLEVVVAETAGWPTPARSYRWFRCDNYVDGIGAVIPAGCNPIVGFVGSTYRLTNVDIQKYIVVEFKLKNSVGEVTKYSSSSLQIRQIPEIADSVSITGNQWVGQKLNAIGIAVTGFPAPVTTLQWLRCASGTVDYRTCAIAASGTDSYVLKVADRGSQIVLKVTATNEAGVTTVTSLPTLEINMAPKLVSLYPTPTGTDDADNEARAATTLTAFEGIWDASPAVNPLTGYAYQWYSCTLRHPVSSTVIPPDCTPIKGQITPNYLVKATDKEKFL
ncbi:MAG: Stenotrophomonas phage, partial [Actinomycetota bacterium]